MSSWGEGEGLFLAPPGDIQRRRPNHPNLHCCGEEVALVVRKEGAGGVLEKVCPE